MSHQCNSGGCHDDHDKPADPLEERVKESARKIKNKLLVMSGKGGVGKSTVAVNVAVALAARGHKVGLMDIDLHGPSVSSLLGLSVARPEGDGKTIAPIRYNNNLTVLSMQNLLPNLDEAVIWRGPMKIGAIRQFLGDVQWGELDYLIIDSPPGTGDEPLTVAQDIDGVRALVVTTPQEVALADVRKSLNFCAQVALPVVGLVENMSGFVCPECGKATDLFGSGGGHLVADKMNVPFLGKIPFDPKVVDSGNAGKPFYRDDLDSPAAEAYRKLVDGIEKQMAAAGAQEKVPAETPIDRDGVTKFAIPTHDGILCAHFGHCDQFAILSVKDGKIVDKQMVTPPPHEPGVLPKWLAEQGIKVIIAGGMGQHAQGFFKQYQINVTVGAPTLSPEEIVEMYLSGNLSTGANACDH